MVGRRARDSKLADLLCVQTDSVDATAFYSSSVSLVVAVLVAAAAQGFVRAKRPDEREAELRDIATVLAFSSISATVSMGVLATGRHSPATASIVAGGLALAWAFLIASYFETARSQTRQKALRRTATRRVVLLMLALALGVPVAGAIALAVWSVIATV